jgi:hypothetical protein
VSKHPGRSIANALQIRPLYDAAATRKAIANLFDKQHRGRRRVACVAYVGQDCRKFIPDPKGVEVFCWPQVGATHPDGIQSLVDAGAIVWFVDRLHTKVYWTEGVGCVVGSANLTNNALFGEGKLREFGLALNQSAAIDVDKLTHNTGKRRATPKLIRDLRTETDLFNQRLGVRRRGRGSGVPSFGDWLALSPRSRPPWKIGYGVSEWNGPSTAERVLTSMGVDSDEQWYAAATDDQFARGDWVLFWFPDSTDFLEWMIVTREMPLDAGDPVRQEGYTRAILQHGELTATPPFKADARLRKVVGRAIRRYGEHHITVEEDERVTPALLTFLTEEWKRAQ